MYRTDQPAASASGRGTRVAWDMVSPEDSQLIPSAAEPARLNWAGNYGFSAQQYFELTSGVSLADAVIAAQALKAVGTRHSFNHIADTPGTQVSVSSLTGMRLDSRTMTVTVGAGVTYGALAPWLHAQGFALHNMASLPHISVVGACATGTHGSGLGNGCLSTAVTALEGIRGDGQAFTISADGATDQEADLLRLASVHLGALGVITAVSLRLEPAFDVAQIVYENLSFDVLGSQLHEIFCAAYSVSLFTDWQQHRATQVWLKHRVPASSAPTFPETFFDAKRQRHKLHPLPNMSAENCTEQMGEPGPWFAHLPHFRLDYTPSAGAELQTEYFVPFELGFKAITAVEALRDRITPLLLVSELRVVAADELPLSMAYRRTSLAIHFTWKQETEAVLALLPLLEAALEPFAPRPHWAKLFTLPPAAVRSRYPRFDDFAQLMSRFDPARKFRNRFLAELIRP